MNHHPIGGKIGWVTLPSYVEYPTSDKRNRNPNWTDSEITRFLSILMEEPVLNDLNAQRNKQVFCYVSQKMASEGCEKSWDQCRVKLKNLKSQWRYVKDRIPGIETADLDDEDVVRQLGQECQTRGVSPSCIKHLRLLKQFLLSLAAVRKGVSPPKFKTETFNMAAVLDVDKLNQRLTQPGTEEVTIVQKQKFKSEDIEESDTFDSADARLVVETGISPPTSPDDGHDRIGVMIVGDDPEDDPDDPGVSDNPLMITTTSSGVLRVKSPTDINTKKRSLDSSDLNESDSSVKKQNTNVSQNENQDMSSSSSAAIIHKFQKEMMEKYLQYQRESEVRFLAWEQERWRMEQQMNQR